MSKKQKVDLSIICCSIKHSPKSLDTYERFTCWKNNYKVNHPLTKEGFKVFKTITYELICKKHNCTKAKVLKYGRKGNFLEIEEYKKENAALKYLLEIKQTGEEIPIQCPVKKIPYAKRIQLFYGYGYLRENKTQPRSLDGYTKGEMIRSPVKITKGDTMTKEYIGNKRVLGFLQENDGKEGYGVIYPDGYQSWSPKEVFEKAYREVGKLTFSEVLELLKRGHKLARSGWNGKGIFIELQRPTELSKMTHPYIFINTTGLQTDNPDAPKSLVPWLASQTDMLAEDWELIS